MYKSNYHIVETILCVYILDVAAKFHIECLTVGKNNTHKSIYVIKNTHTKCGLCTLVFVFCIVNVWQTYRKKVCALWEKSLENEI